MEIIVVSCILGLMFGMLLGWIIGLSMEGGLSERHTEILNHSKIKNPEIRETTASVEIKVKDGKFDGFIESKEQV